MAESCLAEPRGRHRPLTTCRSDSDRTKWISCLPCEFINVLRRRRKVRRRLRQPFSRELLAPGHTPGPFRKRRHSPALRITPTTPSAETSLWPWPCAARHGAPSPRAMHPRRGCGRPARWPRHARGSGPPGAPNPTPIRAGKRELCSFNGTSANQARPTPGGTRFAGSRVKASAVTFFFLL